MRVRATTVTFNTRFVEHQLTRIGRVIKGIIFDFGGVLYGAPLSQISNLEERIGADPAQLSDLLAHSGSAGAWGRFERGEIDVARFKRDLDKELNEVGLETSASQILEVVSGHYNDTLIDYITQELLGNFQLAIVTNNFQIPAHLDPLEKVRGIFEVIVESSKVGYRKPEPSIYDRTFSLLNLAPNEIVYIDDIGANLRYPASKGAVTIKVDPTSDVVQLLRTTLDSQTLSS